MLKSQQWIILATVIKYKQRNLIYIKNSPQKIREFCFK